MSDVNFPINSLLCYKPNNNKIRIGKQNDGGYVIVENMKYDILLGCGIGEDDSFEHHFLDIHKDINCIAFDGTISKMPNLNERVQFIILYILSVLFQTILIICIVLLINMIIFFLKWI